LVDGKMGIKRKYQMGMEMGRLMGMKSLKWERFGTKNLFPHISREDSSRQTAA